MFRLCIVETGTQERSRDGEGDGIRLTADEKKTQTALEAAHAPAIINRSV
jgi:hypothetical protein